MKYLEELKEILRDVGSTYFFLLKIMIPISIIVKILDEYGFIEVIGETLAPVMGVIGLPGEFGLVISTAMITNIYGALVVFFTLSLQYSYSVAQVTILACIMLIAHTLPVEVRIAQKAGVRLWYTLTLRILGAFVFGIILNIIFSSFYLFQNENILIWKPEYNNPTISQWVLGQAGYYLMIFFIILSLMLLMRILKKTGMLDKLNNYLRPSLKYFGMSKNAAILPIIGMTLGLAYGGGIIVKEVKSKLITKKDTFFSLSFMGLSHSLIEDTLLTLTIGASLFGILVGRLIFTLVLMLIIVNLISLLSEEKFGKYFMNSLF